MPQKTTPKGKPKPRVVGQSTKRAKKKAAKRVEAKKPRKWVKAFLAAFAIRGNVSYAAEQAKVDRKTAYRFRDEDEEFAAAWEHAYLDYCDSLENEATIRAVDGWLEPVFYQGVECGYKRKFSDMLLGKLLDANLPAKYRPKTEGAGAGDGVIQLVYVNDYRSTPDPAAVSTSGSPSREGES